MSQLVCDNSAAFACLSLIRKNTPPGFEARRGLDGCIRSSVIFIGCSQIFILCQFTQLSSSLPCSFFQLCCPFLRLFCGLFCSFICCCILCRSGLFRSLLNSFLYSCAFISHVASACHIKALRHAVVCILLRNLFHSAVIEHVI